MTENWILLSQLGIDLKGKKAGILKTKCPVCNKKTSDLSVNIDEGVYKCHKPNCSFHGKVYEKKVQKIYIKPVWQNNTALSEKVVNWFKTRGISQQTLIELKITEGEEWMPQIDKKTNTIQFNYFLNNELVNTKYRDGAKNFKMRKDCELIFYNLDSLKDSDECIIVEGEMDVLSCIESGLKNIISVPNGATLGKQNLEYVDSCYEYFTKINKIILATDNDAPGIALKNELARRLDPDKCWIVDFKECKDSNDYLLKYGSIALQECFKNAKQYPLEGTVTANDIRDDINRLYAEGLKAGDAIGVVEFDELITFELGQKTIITGIPGHGKSEFLDNIMILLAVKHGWKFGIFSPENYPLQIHVSKLAEKLIGKAFSGEFKMNHMEKDAAIDFINDHFIFIYPKDEEFTIENILEITKSLINRKGIRGFVIDPWNRVEHQIPIGISETNYISKELDKLSNFEIKHQVHDFLVVHPTKMKKETDGSYIVPNLYDLMGSSNFFNKTHNGMCVYQRWDKEGKKSVSEIYVQKVKFKHIGKKGMCEFHWNFKNGRYDHISKIEDNNNWLVQEPIPQEPIEPKPINPNPSLIRISEPKHYDEPPF